MEFAQKMIKNINSYSNVAFFNKLNFEMEIVYLLYSFSLIPWQFSQTSLSTLLEKTDKLECFMQMRLS